jgi:hypothetical protein
MEQQKSATAADRKRWISVVHVARKKLNLDDEAYRGILSGAGADSSKDLQTAEQFNEVMKAFVALGFRYQGSKKSMPVTDEQRGNFCNEKQRYYIKGLWELASKAKDEKSLSRMIKRIGGVDDIRFLTKRRASSVILALRNIAWKAGYNPDGPHRDASGEVVGGAK